MVRPVRLSVQGSRNYDVTSAQRKPWQLHTQKATDLGGNPELDWERKLRQTFESRQIMREAEEAIMQIKTRLGEISRLTPSGMIEVKLSDKKQSVTFGRGVTEGSLSKKELLNSNLNILKSLDLIIPGEQVSRFHGRVEITTYSGEPALALASSSGIHSSKKKNNPMKLGIPNMDLRSSNFEAVESLGENTLGEAVCKYYPLDNYLLRIGNDRTYTDILVLVKPNLKALQFILKEVKGQRKQQVSTSTVIQNL
jgi:hypothetical protein